MKSNPVYGLPLWACALVLVGTVAARAVEPVLLLSDPDMSLMRLYSVDNVNAADTANADQVRLGGSLGLALTGSGVTVGIWDGGAVRSDHVEFLPGQVTIEQAVAADNHATHVAGTIGAQGTNPSALGMAPGVTIRSWDFNDNTAELAANAGVLDLSNHSYGLLRGWEIYDWGVGVYDTWFADRSVYAVEDPGFGLYEQSEAGDLDDIMYDNPNHLGVFSAGNHRNDAYLNYHATGEYVTYLSYGVATPGWYILSTNDAPVPAGDGNGGTGYDSLSPAQVAKNTLVVGAVPDLTADPYTGAQVAMTSFSSWGPTDDGRVKPDVVANGEALYSSVSTATNAYGSMSGTSMSAPSATGVAALILEHLRNESGGAEPLSSTLKGVLMHSATDAGNVGPDFIYGYGLLDAAAAAGFVSDALSDAPENSILMEVGYTGAPWSISLVATNGDPLKATIVWTDAAPAVLPSGALDEATPVLVNNLDLWIVGPDSTTYYPWSLNGADPSAAATRLAANSLDNVEQVVIDLPLSGTYTLWVGDTGDVASQTFSLMVTNAVIPEPQTIALAAAGLALLRIRRRLSKRGARRG